MKQNKIALVIPLVKLKRGLDYFDYLIPDKLRPKIKKGQLIEIPFRNKSINGIIFDLTDKTGQKISQLKAVIQIIDPASFLTSWQLQLIKFASQYYFVSMSVIAKMLVPDIPKRKRDSRSEFLYELSFLAAKDIFGESSFKIFSKKPVLVRYYAEEKKIQFYLTQIKKAIKNDKQVLILVPQLINIKKIYPYLAEYKDQLSVFLNDLPKNMYWQEWLKIKKGQAKIIIGTRSAVFAPFNNLQAILIDDEDNPSYKQEEPNPRYNAKQIAFYLQQQLKCRLFFVSPSPSLNSLYQAQKKNWLYGLLDKSSNKTLIKIVNLQDEIRKGNFEILSDYLFEKIEYNAKRGQKIFLFINRKGSATLASCQDCGYIAICPTCKLPLTLHDNKKLICHHCAYSQDVLLSCPQCRSTNIKLSGTGTEKVEAIIREKFPLLSILKIDADNHPSTQDIKNLDLIIGTQYAFDYIDFSQIKLCGIINADTNFYLPDWRSMEKTFNLLMRLNAMLGNSKAEMIVQTYNPENYIYQALKADDYKKYYLNEIKDRQLLKYPPFCRIIRLIYQSIEYNAGQREIEDVYKSIKLKLDNEKLVANPPQLAYTQQVRGRWRWQIILKVLDTQADLNFLNDLPENIIIDPDPENIL